VRRDLPLISDANAIHERLAHVVHSCMHGITNAGAEGLNSQIMAMKRRVGGYRNSENLKTAISFECGGRDLYPRCPWIDQKTLHCSSVFSEPLCPNPSTTSKARF